MRKSVVAIFHTFLPLRRLQPSELVRGRSVQKPDLSEHEAVTGNGSALIRASPMVLPSCYDARMRLALDPFRFLLISLAGWLNQRQQDVIDYLQEENRILRQPLGDKRLRFNDDQRR